MDAVCTKQIVRICSTLEHAGVVATRDSAALAPLLDRPAPAGSAASDLSVSNTVLFLSDSIHLALLHLVEPKIKLMPVIAGLLSDAYGLAVGDLERDRDDQQAGSIAGSALESQLGLGVSCMSAAHLQADAVHGAAANVEAGVYATHLFKLLARQKVAALPAKRPPDDFGRYFFDVATFAAAARAHAEAADFFGAVCWLLVLVVLLL
jgi:hypothetical protein